MRAESNYIVTHMGDTYDGWCDLTDRSYPERKVIICVANPRGQYFDREFACTQYMDDDGLWYIIGHTISTASRALKDVQKLDKKRIQNLIARLEHENGQ